MIPRWAILHWTKLLKDFLHCKNPVKNYLFINVKQYPCCSVYLLSVENFDPLIGVFDSSIYVSSLILNPNTKPSPDVTVT